MERRVVLLVPRPGIVVGPSVVGPGVVGPGLVGPGVVGPSAAGKSMSSQGGPPAMGDYGS